MMRGSFRAGWECPTRPTTRLEGWRAAGGIAHGSLDVAVYACPDHVADARVVAGMAGLTPHTCRTPVETDFLHCGDAFDYTEETQRA